MTITGGRRFAGCKPLQVPILEKGYLKKCNLVPPEKISVIFTFLSLFLAILEKSENLMFLGKMSKIRLKI